MEFNPQIYTGLQARVPISPGVCRLDRDEAIAPHIAFAMTNIATTAALDPVLTWVIPCKGRLAQLQQSLPVLVASAGHEPGVLFLVVDYDCPQHCGSWVERRYPQVKVVRLRNCPVFSLVKARNAGASQVQTPWLGFLDCDVLVTPEAITNLLTVLRAQSMAGASCHHLFVSESRQNELAGFLACASSLFRQLEGYDETFEGWGAEDTDILLRLQQAGCHTHLLPTGQLAALLHDDSVRTAFHVVKDRFVSLRINGLYLQVKRDLAQQMGIPQLPVEHRQGIYQQVKNAVLAAPDAPAHLEITLPASTDVTAPPGWRLKRRWVYSFEPHADPT